MEDCWAKYGFEKGVGSPYGISSTIPANGLFRALLERVRFFIDGVSPEYVNTFNYAEMLLKCRKDKEILQIVPVCRMDYKMFASSFDDILQKYCEKYINQFDEDGNFWSWEELKRAMSQNGMTDFINPGDVLCPELSATWARQRYIGINLLKKIRVDVKCKTGILSGSVHTGIPSSPEEAEREAVRNGSLQTIEAESIGDSRTDIYGPSHGWREGSYCINIDYCIEFKPLIPSGINPNDLFIYVVPYENFDDMGTGLQIGMNRITLNEKGSVYFGKDSKKPSYSHPRPVLNVDFSYGWRGGVLYQTNPVFSFFHDCDDLTNLK